MTSKEGTLPLEDMNLSNAAVPDKLIARTQQWEKIGGAKNILIGVQPSWTTPQAPLLLQCLKQPRQFKATQEQKIEYQNQLTEELTQVIVKESMKTKVYYPTFLVSRSDGRPRKILDYGRNIRIKTKNRIRGFRYYSRPEERLSSYKSEPEIANILRFQVPKQELLLCRSSIWVEKEPIYFFEDIFNCDQSNTQTMERKDSIVYGRHNPPAQIKGVTETEYKRDNDFPSGFRLVTFDEEMLDISQNNFQLPKVEVQYLHDGSTNDSREKKNDEEESKRLNHQDESQINSQIKEPCISDWGNQLHQSLIPCNISLDEFLESSQNQSSIQRNLERSSVAQQSNSGQSLGNFEHGKVEQTAELEGTNIRYCSDNRCIGGSLGNDTCKEPIRDLRCRGMVEGLASNFQQPARACSSPSITQNLESIYIKSTDQIYSSSDRQFDNRVLYPMLESSLSDCASSQTNISSPSRIEYQNHDNTHTWERDHYSGCPQPPILVGGLQNQRRVSSSSTDSNQLFSYTGRFRPSNNETLQKILFTIGRQKSSSKGCLLDSMDKRGTLSSFSNRCNSQSDPETQERRSNSSINSSKLGRDEIQRNDSSNSESENVGSFRDSAGRGQIDAQAGAEVTTRDNRNSTDKYFEGEQLYRKLAAQSGLGQLTIDELIKSISFETWRKRRTGLTYLADYIKSQGKKLEDFLGTRPDAELVNALMWLKLNGGVKYKSKIQSLRTHGCVVLSQFSQMPDISHSRLILAFSKGFDRRNATRCNGISGGIQCSKND
ncbi:MAG: hypothetical protein EZS28_031074 [Streblomastix strix]|uniref:Uncharacterized protein n=1 Tax=Streblomastix strix TaxID=222440 RepID=A0A5J4UTC1_9EUKA|nr:MAG: hypothetical protein EZS28_031074 [Streblomastix strix]